MKPRLHSSQRNAERLGDPGERKIVSESQPHDFSLPFGQSCKGGVEVDEIGGGRRRIRQRLGRVGRWSPLPLHCRDGRVTNDRVEEREELAAQRETGELPQQVQKGLLHHLRGQMFIARETPGEGMNPIAITQVQPVKRRSVTAIDGGDQILVGVLLTRG